MKSILVIVSLAALAGCASKPKTAADIDASSSNVATQTGQYAPGSMADLEKNIGNRIFFAYDQYTLSPQAQEILKKQAQWLKKYPDTRFQIAGNADERGTREYNLALGARRAEAAKAFLIANGVAAVRLTTVSYGKERPIASGSNEDAWAQNRNATSTIGGARS